MITKDEKRTTVKGAMIAMALAGVWWFLYYVFGRVDVPMWIYKAALAFVCVYVPFIAFSIAYVIITVDVSGDDEFITEKDLAEDEEEVPPMKLYGNSSN